MDWLHYLIKTCRLRCRVSYLRTLMRKLFFIFFMLSVFFAEAKLIYVWEDEFTASEKEKVVNWLDATYAAVQAKIGTYPFDVHLHIHRREGKGEPCPWANTWRYPEQQIFFHIDPSYSLEAFLEDWTAPHEMSHLAIPYIGEKEAWFAEGFASFLQYQVMLEMGTMTQEQVDSAFSHKFNSVAPQYNSEASVGTIAVKKRSEGNYKAMYWGGANLFYQWNEQLETKHNRDFCSLFTPYLSCCRKTTRGVDAVVEALDKVYNGNIGSTKLDAFRNAASEDIFHVPGN